MNKNYIFAGAGVLVILIGVLSFVLKQPKPVTVPVPTEEKMVTTETVMEKTDTGFSPETVTVKKGESVKFINKSSTPMWIASAPHPTHTDYPEFDQKANGDSFTFLFDKVGSWKYHNHSPFSSGGMVIVTE